MTHDQWVDAVLDLYTRDDLHKASYWDTLSTQERVHRDNSAYEELVALHAKRMATVERDQRMHRVVPVGRSST